MDKRFALDRLRKLKESELAFYSRESPDQEFYRWREAVLDVLAEACGRSSDVYRDFDGIRFEFSTVRTARLEKFLHHALPHAPMNAVDNSHYFHEQLHQAEEMLLALIIDLDRE